jgi:hypothetical protein
MLMEILFGLWTWLSGRIPPGASSVWGVLWDADAEWLALPAGQHRSGISVARLFDRLDLEEEQAWRKEQVERRSLVTA